MQFTGHSLPVHHSVAAQWDLHLFPYYQPSSPARFLSINGHWDVSLPLSLEWHVCPDRRSKYNISILSEFNNALVWMISTRFLISTSSSPCTNPLATIPKVPVTIGIIVTFMFHSLFSSQARSMYLSFSLSFNFTPWSAGTTKLSFFIVDYYKVRSSDRD